MQGETFWYNGEKHISKRDGSVYFVNKKWTIHILAKALWEKYHKMLRWREYGFGRFYAFVEGNDNYATGSLWNCDDIILNSLFTDRSQSNGRLSCGMKEALLETLVDILAGR
uniref:Uncharacterized protein n=1 Tax=Marseillevirus sp. TaxID=2809551 RepID=A0AA96EMN7_9VIRU|nr:hypothetical protein MarDSR_488 [Marseillevirus sp.]